MQLLIGDCSPPLAACAELQAPTRSCHHLPFSWTHTRLGESLSQSRFVLCRQGNNLLTRDFYWFSAKRSIVYKPGTASAGAVLLQHSSPLPRLRVASSLTHQLQLFTVSVTHPPFTTHDFDRDLGCYLQAFSSGLI